MRFILIVLFLISLKTEAQSSVLSVADSLFSVGNYTKAITQYKLLKEDDKAHNKLAKAYAFIGNYGESLKHYKIHLNQYPERYILKYEYAKLLSRTKKYSEAKTIFNELIEIDNENANYYCEMGVLNEAEKNYKNAANHFALAVAFDSTHQKAIYKLGKLCMLKKDFKKVDELVDLGLKSYPDNTSLISLKAQSAYYQKRYWDAISNFENLLTLGEKSKFIFEKLAKSYGKVYHDDKAIKYMKVALELDPNDARNIYLLGRYYFNLEQYEDAKVMVLKSIALQEVTLDNEYIKLAKIYNYLKQPQDAIQAYSKALRYNPKNEQAAFFEAFTKDRYYKDDGARIKIYETFLKKYPKSKYLEIAEKRLSELKKEQFMSKEQPTD